MGLVYLDLEEVFKVGAEIDAKNLPISAEYFTYLEDQGITATFTRW